MDSLGCGDSAESVDLGSQIGLVVEPGPGDGCTLIGHLLNIPTGRAKPKEALSSSHSNIADTDDTIQITGSSDLSGEWVRGEMGGGLQNRG